MVCCMYVHIAISQLLLAAKFGGNVSGTLGNDDGGTVTLSETVSSEDNTLRYEFGTPLFWAVLAIGSTIILVILCLIMVCVCLQCKRMYKRKL